MARGSEAAAKKSAGEPNDLYDKLTTDEQQIFDSIDAKGFRPERDESLRWHALATNGDDKVGPAPTLSDLAIDVDQYLEAAGELEDAAKVTKIKEDSRGNRYLDGMEPVVDQEIAAAAGKYHAIKTERVALTTKEVAAKDELAEVCHRKKEFFKVDPDNTNAKIYKVGDLVVRIQNEFKEKISTEIVESE
jgi:chaperonin cofactor prefoldin